MSLAAVERADDEGITNIVRVSLSAPAYQRVTTGDTAGQLQSENNMMSVECRWDELHVELPRPL